MLILNIWEKKKTWFPYLRKHILYLTTNIIKWCLRLDTFFLDLLIYGNLYHRAENKHLLCWNWVRVDKDNETHNKIWYLDRLLTNTHVPFTWGHIILNLTKHVSTFLIMACYSVALYSGIVYMSLLLHRERWKEGCRRHVQWNVSYKLHFLRSFSLLTFDCPNINDEGQFWFLPGV